MKRIYTVVVTITIDVDVVYDEGNEEMVDDFMESNAVSLLHLDEAINSNYRAVVGTDNRTGEVGRIIFDLTLAETNIDLVERTQ